MVEFPLAGPSRLVTLGLEFVVVVLCAQFAAFFAWKYYARRKAHHMSRIFLLWAVYFVAFGGMWAIYLPADYYAPTALARYYYLCAGYLWMNVSLLGFAWILETFVEFRLRPPFQHLFTLLFSCTLVLLVALTVVNPELAQSLSMVIVGPTAILLLRYCYLLYQRLKATRKAQALVLFAAVVLQYGGYLLTSDVGMDLFSPAARAAGDVLIIAGLVFSAWFFNHVPSIESFDWYNMLDFLFVVDNAGVSVFSTKFSRAGPRGPPGATGATGATNSPGAPPAPVAGDLPPGAPPSPGLSDQLVSGAFTSVKTVLETLVERGSRLRTLAQEDTVFLLAYGKHLTFVLMVQKALPSHHLLLNRFAHEFERTYAPVLADWDGDISRFETAGLLVDRVFEAPS